MQAARPFCPQCNLAVPLKHTTVVTENGREAICHECVPAWKEQTAKKILTKIKAVLKKVDCPVEASLATATFEQLHNHAYCLVEKLTQQADKIVNLLGREIIYDLLKPLSVLIHIFQLDEKALFVLAV